MSMKMRYLTVGILLMTLSLAAFKAPLLAQDSPDPAATEDPCLAKLDLAWENLDENAPDVFEDPAFMECLDTLETVGEDPAKDPELASVIESLATPEAVANDIVDNTNLATQQAPALRDNASTEPHNFISVTNSCSCMVRFWVSWFDGVTGALGAAGSGEFTMASSRVVWVPSNAKNISVRIEVVTFDNQNNWSSPPYCSWFLGADLQTSTFPMGWPSLWTVTSGANCVPAAHT